jgi:hypothetical protein
VRGWLITGRTGSGKTQCAINTITFQLFQNVKNLGGVCLDQKGLYWEIIVKLAAHFGREHDLVLLQTPPPGEDALWRAARLPCLPSLTISLSSDERVEIQTDGIPPSERKTAARFPFSRPKYFTRSFSKSSRFLLCRSRRKTIF